MRTSIRIDDAQITALDRLAQQENVSRASLIRRAIDDYLQRQQGSLPADAFGLWANETIDGLAFQEKMRDDW